MCTRYLTGLMLLVALPVLAQEAEPETVHQLSATQAHLQGVGPQALPTAMKTHTMVRLAGKLLSENIKGLRVELDPTPASSNDVNNLSPQEQSPWRLNRRAEICYDNYRLGLQRGGAVMRYELTF
jgi:hypothetical protein